MVMTRKRFAIRVATVLAAAGLAAAAAAQGDDEDAAAYGPGKGLWQATVQPSYTKPASVALDSECDDEVSADLRDALEKRLKRMGIAVDNDAAMVLRYAITPCTVLARNRNAQVREAYGGSSKPEEIPSVRPQVKLKFGGKSESADRLLLSFLLYMPGATPSWRADGAVGRSHATRQVQFETMAATMLAAMGTAQDGTLITP
ncbi:MAG: hypothetical protein D6782_00420 [Alphaproteobacteria bacterium]|nr:MAG: hypothetical protein D6782_00420 [Alphaproteobacteria bacterium]